MGLLTTLDLSIYINKNISIRSKYYPGFLLIEGVLNECNGDFEYTIEFENSRYSFDTCMVREIINNTFFI